MRFLTKLSDFLRCKRGNAMILIATTAPLLIGAAAIGLDSIQLTVTKATLQRTADSAAIAGALARQQKSTQAAVTSAVDRDLTLNNAIELASPRIVQNAPQTGPYAGDERAVRVVLTAKRAVPFMSFFTSSSTQDIQVEATAAAVETGNYCVISLENTATTGITFAGSSNTNLGCGVATNATGANAVSVNGNPKITADPVAARGTVPPSSAYQGATVISNAPAQLDPLAHLPHPALPTTCSAGAEVKPNEVEVLSPGCYRGMDLKGTVTLLPGTYYIDGGVLSFGSQANVTGIGVTFVLTSSNAVSNPASIASLDMNGGAAIKLTAPTTGDYAGVIIYQDRRSPNQSPKINGGSGAVLDGAIYMPTQDVTFNGNAGMVVKCLRMVTLRVTFSGNSDTVNTCPTNAPTRGFSGLTVRLVR